MLIKVKVYPGSKHEEIIKKSNDSFLIRVKEKAEKNQANFRVFQLLSWHFNIPQNCVKIINGAKNQHKIFEINLREE